MLRQISLTLLVSACCAMAGEAPAENAPDCVELPPDPRPACIDAVARVRIVEYRPGPMPDLGPDTIVMSWTWDVDVDVREVYLGDLPRGRLTIGATLHTYFNDELHQPILFLTRTREGGWYLAHVAFAARDRSGGYVIPVYEADWMGEVSPQGWLPSDHLRWLKPAAYRSRDVAGFEHNWDELPDGEDEWQLIRGDKRSAKRGFFAADLPRMLAERRALDCRR